MVICIKNYLKLRGLKKIFANLPVSVGQELGRDSMGHFWPRVPQEAAAQPGESRNHLKA